MRTPDGGIQPQAAVDDSGVVHLIYYQGDPGGGDVFYVRRAPSDSAFSKPLQVNSQKGSAMAMGTIRGAQLAVGRKGRVHVVWNGMGSGTARVSINGKATAPLLFTRLNDEGTGFEPERNLITFAAGLDGGSSVAADPQGNVYAVWHASPPGTEEESSRAVFVARSHDDGRTFQPETQALSTNTGACSCCGMRAFADSSGAVYILFRGAAAEVNRDEFLLVSRQPGSEFFIANVDRWRIGTCPMSSASITQAKGGVLAAWETAEKIRFATVSPRTRAVSAAISPPGESPRKHPVIVANDEGETLLTWTEGTGWGRGGSVVWQLYTKNGKPASEQGRVEGLPAWSLASAYVTRDGQFAIVY
jgi:hypothetical protein